MINKTKIPALNEQTELYIGIIAAITFAIASNILEFFVEILQPFHPELVGPIGYIYRAVVFVIVLGLVKHFGRK